MTPLISIVTPCLNRAAFIADAVESVLAQPYPRIEHVVVDGGSTDGTIRVLKRYPHLKWISEPDKGVYDALNKAIGLTEGSIVGHLNSDDLYAENVFPAVASIFAEDPSIDMVHGGAEIFASDPAGTARTVSRYVDSALTAHNITVGMPLTNARFFRRSVYDRVGLYDTRYLIAADRDFLLRALIAHTQGRAIPNLMYRYRQHDASLTIGGLGRHARVAGDEYLSIAEHYLRTSSDRDLRQYLTRWVRQTVSDMVWSGIVWHDRELAAHFAANAWRRDRLWPLRFARYCTARIVQYLQRGWSGIGRDPDRNTCAGG